MGGAKGGGKGAKADRHPRTAKNGEASSDAARAAVRVAGALAAALVAAAVGAAALQQSSKTALLTWDQCRAAQGERFGDVPPACQNPPIVTWSDEHERHWAKAMRRPIVFEQAPSEEWAVRKSCSGPEWLEQALGGQDSPVNNVFESTSQTILYFNPSLPLGKVKSLKWDKPFRHINTTVRELVRAVRGEPQGDLDPSLHYYFSANLYDEETLAPLRGLLNQSVVEPFVIDDTEGQIHLWTGMDNLTARAHYDTYHNFYVQLAGRKEFVLYPPEFWDALYLFPILHPSARHSQLAWHDWGEPFPDELATQFPLAARLPAPQRVVLEAGQVLYLPPFWFHQVRSVDESVSINVWSMSRDGTLSASIVKDAVPWVSDPRWSDAQIDLAAFELVLRLVEQLGAGGPQVLEKALETQYAPLGLDRADAGARGADDRILFGLTCGGVLVAIDDLPGPLLHEVGKHAAKLFGHFRELTPDVRPIVLANFAQGVAQWSTSAAKTYAYLRCMRDSLAEAAAAAK